MIRTSLRQRIALTALAAAAVPAALTVMAAPASAAAPGNDALSSAVALTSGVQVSAVTTGAGVEAGEDTVRRYLNGGYEAGPIGACVGGASVWYAVPPTTGRLHLTIDSTTYDSAVKLWRAGSAAPGVATLAGQQGLRPQTAGETVLDADLFAAYHYWIAVDSCNASNHAQPLIGTDVGTVTFTPTLTPRPANDDIAHAIDITTTATPMTADIRGAGAEQSEDVVRRGPAGGNLPGTIQACIGARSTWYRLPNAGQVGLTVTAIDFDGVLKVWSANTANPAVNQLSGVAGIRPQSAGEQLLTITENARGFYFLDVDSCGNQSTAPDKLTAAPEGTVTFSVDAAAPTAALTAPDDGFALAPTGKVTVAGTASDVGAGLSSVTFTLDHSSTGVVTASPTATGYTAVLPVATTAPGTYVLRMTALDNAGLSTDVTRKLVLNGPVAAGYALPNKAKSVIGARGVTTKRMSTVSVPGVKPHGLGSSTLGGSLTLRMIGRQLDLRLIASPGSGRVTVKVDRTTYTFDLYAKHAHVVLKSFPNLAPGHHTVVISVKGRHSTKSLGSLVAVTGFRVYA